jgi:DNA-directed RNA polymerase specialized sigma24 family protein
VRSEEPGERDWALETIVAAYWKPVYKYLRRKWNEAEEDARDRTQAFFALAMEKGFFEGYDPSRARFRTYLRTCLDGFVQNERKFAARQKRSPGGPLLPLDFESADGELRRYDVPETVGLEEFFRREWVRSLFAGAVERLRAELEARGRAAAFRLFEAYDLDEGRATRSYADLAAEHAMPVTQVTNALALARREFRRILLEDLRAVTGSEAEFQEEARALLGKASP